jgi:hypothetical protein
MKKGYAHKSLLLVCTSVAFLMYIASVFVLGPQQARDAQQLEAITALTLEVEKLAARHAQLVEDQRSMHEKFEGFTQRPSDDIASSQRDVQRFASKLEQLERDLAAIGQVQENRAQTSESLGEKLLTETLKGADSPNLIGEKLYKSDYGAALEGREERLSAAFDSAGVNGGLAQVSCKSTICKVTYRADEMNISGISGVSALDDRLVNELTEGYRGADLRMHHGSDESGNRVMYIEERR